MSHIDGSFNDDEEDEVVRELDVFASNNLDLFLLQLPLKPCYMQPPNLATVRYKKENRILEIQGATESDAIEKSSSGSTIPFLQSSRLGNKKSNLAVGIIKNNQMHITPVQDVFQLRPSFHHLQQQLESNLSDFIVDDNIAMNVDGEVDNDNNNNGKDIKSNKPLLQQVNSNDIYE